jgi:hypothetical protein
MADQTSAGSSRYLEIASSKSSLAQTLYYKNRLWAQPPLKDDAAEIPGYCTSTDSTVQSVPVTFLHTLLTPWTPV